MHGGKMHGIRGTRIILLMTDNEITFRIRGAIFDVYNELGPGLLESIYEEALIVALKNRGLNVEQQVSVPVIFQGKRLPCDYRIDILVEKRVIIELKSVQEVKNVFHLQLLTYMKISKIHIGILVNFNCDNINNNIFRKII